MAWKGERVACKYRRISGRRFSRKYVCVCMLGKGGVGRIGLVCDTDCRALLFLIVLSQALSDDYDYYDRPENGSQMSRS